ncbi:hypothetical protein BU25DRAFT_345580 [Macroventuria anomochaeta]|uniref:Uncharacterized protein n=1 Tax=Macroventuria anomochaeta TaxID=301207 RepID=A0ACB6RUK3_9PLEO|nr:uncharacterized protein BU25DRAFT_345580 [Macroventuria anomochaeta]KAF2625423.1 hypothetical protein BU25DRAFT_345580 [Macroventuria anomochaeta]
MSSRLLLRRPARPSLARSHRSHAGPNVSGIRPPTRAFHASAPRQDPVLDAILYLPHEMMTLIHTQVPWYAAIPAAAFLLRGALVTGFGTWARSLMARYIGLQPLRQALARQKRDQVLRQMHNQGGARTPQEAKTRTMAEVKQVVTKLDSRWRVTLKGQIGWTLIQIPVFFTMAEVIRKMCGARDGLLALTASSVKGIQGCCYYQCHRGNRCAAVTTSPFFEPSLATEGMLWFPSLITPDPLLPFVVSGLMFSNIYFTNNTISSDKNWPNAIRRALLGVSLLIGPLCQNLPAGLMLYWASSTTSVMLWNKWLDWKYPAPRDFTACKRPLQMPPAMKSKTQTRRF